jgi:hypothetical protein
MRFTQIAASQDSPLMKSKTKVSASMSFGPCV